MARANIVTLLSLDRYARIMGISPPHFNGAAGSTVFPMTPACADIWYQHSWQKGDRVSREDLALAIYNAEYDIARQLGYFPAQKWIVNEMHQYPRHRRRSAIDGGTNVRGFSKSVVAKFGKIIDTGQRALGDKIDVVPVYSTAQLPITYDETVTVTAAHGGETDIREWKVFVADKGGDPKWEIRDPRSVYISGANVVLKFWAWQFINPVDWDEFPMVATEVPTLSLEDLTYLADCDVYRVYNDNTAQSAEFFWEPEEWLASPIACAVCGGDGCATCSLTTQDGCAHIRDVDSGILVPMPGTYSDDDSRWELNTWTDCRAPDQVKVWYQAGELSQRYLDAENVTSDLDNGAVVDPLSDYWAEAISWLATARLERTICACKNVVALANDLRRDVSRTDPDGPAWFVDPADLSNPFGTRLGEIKAWRRVSKIASVRAKVAVI